jgi:putative transposase
MHVRIIAYRSIGIEQLGRRTNTRPRVRVAMLRGRRQPSDLTVGAAAGAGEPALGLPAITGELNGLGISVSATTGEDPAAGGTRPCRQALRAVLACLFASAGLEHARGRLLHGRDDLVAAAVPLFFIELGSRRVHLAGCTANPTGASVTQQARQFTWALHERPGSFRFLIRDRDSKFTRDFDAVFASEGIEIIKTPVRAPKANAAAERFVRTARVACLDWLLIMNRRHLERVLCVFAQHYNTHRPHRSLNLAPPELSEQKAHAVRPSPTATVERRDRLGGLIHEYDIAA